MLILRTSDCHLSMVIIVFLSMLLLIGSLKWELAPREILEKGYFPYELCILDSPLLYNTTETPHTQSRCSHKIDDKIKNIPKRCWLGSRQQTADYGMCLNVWWGCQPLANRTGFWKHFSDLPQSSFGSYEIELLTVIKNMNFEIINFVGDSMAVQLTQHLLCKLLRESLDNFRYIHQDLNAIRAGGTIATIYLNKNRTDDALVSMSKLPSGIGTSNVKGRFAMKGIEKECRNNQTCRQIFASNYIYTQTLRELKVGNKWKNTLHILLFPIINKETWEFKPFANAIYQAAKLMKNINSAILIMGPLYQHFPNHPQGLYTSDPYAKNGQPACVPLQTDKPFTHPESIKMQAALNEVDVEWRSVLGWFEAGFVSHHWHDMHPELHATGWAVDCTHYAYSPFMMSALWANLSDYLVNNASRTWWPPSTSKIL